MFRLPKEDQQKAAMSLQNNPAFSKIIKVLQSEYDISVKSLMTSNSGNFGVIQGRTQLLRELLDALTHNY